MNENKGPGGFPGLKISVVKREASLFIRLLALRCHLFSFHHIIP